MNIVLSVAGLVAVAALAMEYGFRRPPLPESVLSLAQGAVVMIFVLDRLLRLALARDRRAHLRDNWIDFALLLALAAGLLASFELRFEIVSAGALYVLVTQAYILIILLLRAVGLNLRLSNTGVHPTWLLLGSFAFLILAGTGALMLERSTSQDHPISFVDALFTSASATCVTGLSVLDTGSDFTPLGHAIILVLIQLGGLGLMLFGTFFALLVGRELSARASGALGIMLASERAGEMKRLAMFVVVVTLVIEGAGAALFYPMFAQAGDNSGLPMPAARTAFYSVFHSVSAFCNAGLSLYRDNMMQGVKQGWAQPLRAHWQVLGVMAPLIVLGGLGFPVLQDIGRCLSDRLRQAWRRLRGLPRLHRPRPHLTLHSRIVLTTTGSLLVLGAAALILVEPPQAPPPGQEIPRDAGYYGEHKRYTPNLGDWPHTGAAGRVHGAIFQSVSARTAGFNSINLAELSDAGKLVLCWLMLIGGSPASTAGGMKTVTFAVMLIIVYSVLRRRRDVEAYQRKLSTELVRMSVTIVVLYLLMVAASTLLLSVTLQGVKGISFLDIFFEASSACGTVGLSTGVTGVLNEFGKYVVIFSMYLGRVGPLTLLLAFTSKWRHVDYSYPQEEVVIG